ncbi:hypothetical protein F5Y05DRAFT_418223 [Hypoxylon sp. FL0543]|nr:hypothetical protein F5Y05DRAFT_418223 [Hypoxylon sp. FL0543]
MSATPRSPDQKEPKSKQHSPSHLHSSTANKKGDHRSTGRDTPHRTEKPVGQPPKTAPGVPHNKTNNTTPPTTGAPKISSTYQNPGPGFEHTVRNVPGVGWVYDHNPVQGFNPALGQQPHIQHQGPGLTHPQTLPPGFVQASASPEVLPPGFTRVPASPQFVSPVSQPSNPAMAYATVMPNQGQNFQPPVPDTTYGEIPHTYIPRFDPPAGGGQYVTINGKTYRVDRNGFPQNVAAGGVPVQFMPLQQVPSSMQAQAGSLYVPSVSSSMQAQAGSVPSAVQAIPCYVAQQASPQPVYYLVNASLIRTLGEVAAGAANPIVVQQGAQQPVFVQAQPGVPGIAQPAPAAVQPAPVAAQPGAFPPMVGQPQAQVFGVHGMPGAYPAGAAPDVMGIGKTGLEVQIENFHTAQNTKAFEGQDIAPADPDVSRMYYCRELDGAWTLRNRYSIDKMGDWRWYVMPGGIFYAIRLAD